MQKRFNDFFEEMIDDLKNVYETKVDPNNWNELPRVAYEQERDNWAWEMANTLLANYTKCVLGKEELE